LVASGITLSRLAGLVRQRALSHFLGLGPEADAFMAAFRIPNILQNLLGEGALSASFIPVYSRLLGAGDNAGARRVAGAAAGLLGVVVGVAVLAGVASAAWLVDVLAPGFEGAKRELTVRLVRILFPGAGCLVLSAWCLGILNSHRRFFLSYAAPVVWNLAIILTVVVAGPSSTAARLAVLAALGAVAGSLLQLLVQLPGALRASGGVRLSLGRGDAHTAEVRRLFGPALLNRGVNQVSAWMDTLIASLLPTGAVAALVNAQLLYTLPVSLFGISVAAAELPAMASAAGREADTGAALRARLDNAMSRIAFFVVPSAAAFLGLGYLIAGLVFQSGRFTAGDARYVWGILAGSAVGLLAATLARLLASAFYALGDSTTPFRIAALRVAQATAVGYVLAIHGVGWLGLDPRWGTAGLTLSSGVAGWVEFTLLRRRLTTRIGRFGPPPGRLFRLWAAALVALTAAWAVALGAVRLPVTIQALLAITTFGVGYLSVAALLGVPQVGEVLRGLRRGT
jgi:putative peptidoglycan lipid II flippase